MAHVRGGRGTAVVVAVASSVLAAGCGGEPERPRAAETAGAAASWVRGSEPWRGVLLGGGDAVPAPAVTLDVVPELPAAAPAYIVVAPTPDDLMELAERHAGAPVQPGTMPGASPDLLGFEAGDGWFMAHRGYLADDYVDLRGDSWSWTQRAWRENPPPEANAELVPCPVGTPVPAAVEDFFATLDIAIEPTGRMECAGRLTNVRLDVLLDGVRIVDSWGTALVDESGDVVGASAPFMTFAPLGDLELAPIGEVLRRLVHGPGTLGPTSSCPEPCEYSTRSASVALGLFRTGGLGSHDHTPNNLVPGPTDELVLPVLRAPATSPTDPSTGIVALSAIALSSGLLVDDPSQADAARSVDLRQEIPSGEEATSGCAGPGGTLVVCSSSFVAVVGEPVILTVGGEVNEPIGARECDPILSLHTGDGPERTAPPPRTGTLVSARLAHVRQAGQLHRHGASSVAMSAGRRCRRQ